MPNGSRHVPFDCSIARRKSGAVSSSHFAESLDCALSGNIAKREISKTTKIARFMQVLLDARHLNPKAGFRAMKSVQRRRRGSAETLPRKFMERGSSQRKRGQRMAGTTRLELATSAVTGQRSNQLNYVPAEG